MSGAARDTPQSIEGAARRLREAGATLRARPSAEVLAALCGVVDMWGDPGSRWRRRLETELPAAAGFSKATVREGLARGLDHWRGRDLSSVFGAELAAIGGGECSVALGHELSAVLLAGSIPMPSLLDLILPLTLRSPVLVKTASRDPVTAPLVVESIAAVDAGLAGCVEVVSFPGSDDACVAAFTTAECVVASGSDATVARIASRVKPPQRLLRHGHRLSLALLGPTAGTGRALRDAARGLAMDVVLWDQLGCLSPVAVFVVDPADGVARNLARAIADELRELATRLPRGETDPSVAAAIAHERGEAEMRAAAGRRVEVLASSDTSWTVVLEDRASWLPTPLHRFLRVHPLTCLEELGPALVPVSAHLACVAIAGFAGETASVQRALVQWGASRVCAPGQMQSPPLAWHRDGEPLLLPLARIADLEPL